MSFVIIKSLVIVPRWTSKKKKTALGLFGVCLNNFNLLHGSVIDTRGLVNDTADWQTTSRNSNCHQRIGKRHRCWSVNGKTLPKKNAMQSYIIMLCCWFSWFKHRYTKLSNKQTLLRKYNSFNIGSIIRSIWIANKTLHSHINYYFYFNILLHRGRHDGEAILHTKGHSDRKRGTSLF